MTSLLGRPGTDASLGSGGPDCSPVCSAPGCGAEQVLRCSYVDRRQRHCPTIWCSTHRRVFLNTVYCRRHVSIVAALKDDPSVGRSMPDLENRAPSLANWVGRDLDAPIRALLKTHFAGQRTNDSQLVSGGSARERTWGRSWKLISSQGVDLSVAVTVAEADDSVVRITYDGKVLSEQTPPWIEDRREGKATDPAADLEGRRAFYGRIVGNLELAMVATKRRPHQW